MSVAESQSIADRADAQLDTMMLRAMLVFLPLAAVLVGVMVFVIQASWHAWLPIVVAILLMGCLYELGYSRGQRAALRLTEEEHMQNPLAFAPGP